MIDTGVCVYIHVCGTVKVSWWVYGGERTTLTLHRFRGFEPRSSHRGREHCIY